MTSQSVGRINIKALAVSVALFWGCIVGIVALANLFLPPYGREFLQIAASIYPGYEAEATLFQAFCVTFYAAVDGAIAGLAVAWLYNRIA